MRMLRRAGLPELHARFAPCFLTSHQIQLNPWSTKVFNRLEQAFFATQEELSTVEIRMLAHQKHYDTIMMSSLEPRQESQHLLQRAFRDCSFHVEVTNQQVASATVKEPRFNRDDQDDKLDRLELIPEVPIMNAPPGLAPQVRGQLESYNKHRFYTYTGRWKNGDMHGALGVYSFADGGKYRGTFVHNVPSGNGTVVYPNGVKYTGTFADGKFHGFGVMEMERGYCYEGEFQRGKRCGVGKLQLLRSGAVYEGEFYNNMRHGQGTETSGLGYSYVGTWRCNRLCGNGRLLCPDKRKVVRADWPPLLLGEAIRLVKREIAEATWRQELWYRRLFRVRDDLRALDLQYAFWETRGKRVGRERDKRVGKMKHARRHAREALATSGKVGTEQGERGGQYCSDESSHEDDSESESSEGASKDGTIKI